MSSAERGERRDGGINREGMRRGSTGGGGANKRYDGDKRQVFHAGKWLLNNLVGFFLGLLGTQVVDLEEMMIVCGIFLIDFVIKGMKKLSL